MNDDINISLSEANASQVALDKKEKVLQTLELRDTEHTTGELALMEEDSIDAELKATLKNKKTKKQKKPLTWRERFKLKPYNKWIKISFAYKTSFANLETSNRTREYAKMSINISPIKYLFFGASFNKTLNEYYNQYYQPDFSYSFGYSDWHQDTWSLVYSNYANNKFNPKGKQKRFNFSAGIWRLGYKTKVKDIYLSGAIKYLHKRRKTKIELKSSKKIGKDTLVYAKFQHYFPSNQNQLELSARSFLYKKFFVAGSVYAYTDNKNQFFLDPDYAYSFGWKDSRKHKINIIYSNYYTATRWPWKEKEGPNFNRGSLSVSVKF